MRESLIPAREIQTREMPKTIIAIKDAKLVVLRFAMDI